MQILARERSGVSDVPCGEYRGPDEFQPLAHDLATKAWARKVRVFGVALLSCMFLATSAWSMVVFTVDSTADDVDDNTALATCHTAAGKCTLRAAVMQANMTNDDVTINLPAGNYGLGTPVGADGDGSGDLNLTAPAFGNPVITITGAGSATTIITANYNDRVLTVAAGRTAVIGNVTLGYGYFAGPGADILNHGVLTLTNAVVRHGYVINTGNCGGGIYNDNQLGIYSSTITDSVGDPGAGICNEAGAGLTLVASAIVNSYSFSRGGGLYNAGVVVMRNSTISGNQAASDGGGIYNAGTVNVYNSTIVSNAADANGDSVGTGGGVFNELGKTFNLRNTVIAGNGATASYDDCKGTLASYGRTRFWTAGGCTVNQVGAGGASLMVSLAELGPLQDNGGPTPTHALVLPTDLLGSAVGCVDNNSVPLRTDQRHRPRPPAPPNPLDGTCDIGAFEYNEIFPADFEAP